MQEMMLNKTYDPGQVEEKIYEMWMDKVISELKLMKTKNLIALLFLHRISPGNSIWAMLWIILFRIFLPAGEGCKAIQPFGFRNRSCQHCN